MAEEALTKEIKKKKSAPAQKGKTHTKARKPAVAGKASKGKKTTTRKATTKATNRATKKNRSLLLTQKNHGSYLAGAQGLELP